MWRAERRGQFYSLPPGMTWWDVLRALTSAVALVWYVLLWGVCILGYTVSKKLFEHSWPRSPLSSANAESVPGVSILRPLAGLDCNLFTNLCSTFEQRYPYDRYEVILSVRSADDQALGVARRVQERYPHVSSTILVGDVEAGVNPKINNLVRSYAAAKYDIIWVVDSQVWLSSDAMGRAVDALTMPPTRPSPHWLHRVPHGHRVGLVHHVPLGVLPADTLASHVERVFLSTTHAKMYLAINAVAVDSCVMGKSNMYRKSDLERVPDTFFHYAQDAQSSIGSRAFDDHDVTHAESGALAHARALARFGIYLAEDNMLALSLWRPPVQLAHRVSPGDVAQVAVGDINTLAEYAKRRMRWIRVRRHMVPMATYLEPFTESILAGVCGWYAVRVLLLNAIIHSPLQAWLACALFFSLHWAAWYYVDMSVLLALRHGEPLPEAEQRYVFVAWCVRELLAFPIWAWAMLGHTVTWRGRRYRILRDARAAAAETDAADASLLSD